MISKVVCLDKSFGICKWLEKSLSDLLKPLKVYVDVAKKLCNCNQETWIMISRFWEPDIANLIKNKWYFQYILKLIFKLSQCKNISNIQIAFYLVNAQTVSRIMESKNRYAICWYIISNDWLQVLDTPILIRNFLLEKLVKARVYINPDGEISIGAPILPHVPSSSPAPSSSAVLADLILSLGNFSVT